MERFIAPAEEAEAHTSTYQKLSSLVRGDDLEDSSADDDGILQDYRENHND